MAGIMVLQPPEPASPVAPVIEPTSPPSPLNCQPGTYEDGDRCSPIEWSPDLVACNDNGCTIPRWVAVRLLDDPEFRRGQGRAVPSFRDDTQIGYKIYGVRANKLGERLGVSNGDTVYSIDGQDIVEHGEALVSRIRKGKGTDTLVLGLRRGGEELERTMVLVDALTD